MKDFVSAAALRALAALVSVCAFAGAAAAQTSSWLAQDIGAPALSGSTTIASGFASETFTIEAAGSDISGSSDQFHFVYQALTGDAEIVARLDSLTAVNPWTVAGVMVRGSLAANAPHAFAGVTPSRGVYFRARPSAGANTSQLSGPTHTPPTWVRLVRQGSMVRGFTSTDGAAWTNLGSASVSLGDTVYVGLAVTSRHSRNRTTAVASNVAVRSIGLPPGLHSADIGSPALPGDVFASAGLYSVTAAGSGIDGTADQFHLVYQPVAGNVDVVARVASIEASTAGARAGVTIRESLAAESRHATAVLSKGSGYAFQRRIDPAGTTALTAGGGGTAPGWVRLVRTGDLFEAYRSFDGVSWTKMGGDVVPMGETVYVGLAATSHSVTSPSTSSLDNFSITTSAWSGNRAPAVSILAPASGTQVTLPATVTISALASDPENRMLAVDFYADYTLLGRVAAAPYSVVWSPSSAGTYTLTAVAHDADGASTTSSAVTVQVQPRPNTPPVVSLSTGGTTFTAPATITLTAGASDADGHIARVEFFSGGTKLNTDTTAPYSFTWSSVPAGTYTLTAVAFDNEGASTTSAPVTITVQPAPNKPPVVSLATNNTNFNAPASITLTATASDPDGSIARVEFFSGTTRLSTVTAAPYTFTWSNVAAGTYTLTAVAFDNQGASTTSAPVTVTVHKVTATVDPPRYVAFVASSDHATNVTKYMLKVYGSNANPSTATPLATSDLGKPTPSSTGEIVVDRATFFSNLAAGSYQAVVTSVNSAGETPSASVAFSR